MDVLLREAISFSFVKKYILLYTLVNENFIGISNEFINEKIRMHILVTFR